MVSYGLKEIRRSECRGIYLPPLVPIRADSRRPFLASREQIVEDGDTIFTETARSNPEMWVTRCTSPSISLSLACSDQPSTVFDAQCSQASNRHTMKRALPELPPHGVRNNSPLSRIRRPDRGCGDDCGGYPIERKLFAVIARMNSAKRKVINFRAITFRLYRM